MQDARPRYALDAAEGDRIARAFFAAARDGDTGALSALLAEDVAIHMDGGGKVLAFHNVVQGLDRVRRLYASLHRKAPKPPRLLRMATIDGLPGYVSIDGREVLQTTALEIRNGRIVAIYIVSNPEKLMRVQSFASASAPGP